MKDQSKAKMFVSKGRAHIENEQYRSFSTLTTNSDAFGPIYLLKDDTLASQQSLKYSVEADTQIILLPTVGTIVYQDTLRNQKIIHAGQIQIVSLPKGADLIISNPYEDQLVNYIQILMRKPFTGRRAVRCLSFDINNRKNWLVDLMPDEKASDCLKGIRIGKFAGRNEAVHKLRNSRHGVFVFVLEGAFEVQHRLMESRDALALWNTDEIELEALSNDAILCLLEVEID